MDSPLHFIAPTMTQGMDNFVKYHVIELISNRKPKRNGEAKPPLNHQDCRSASQVGIVRAPGQSLIQYHLEGKELLLLRVNSQ